MGKRKQVEEREEQTTYKSGTHLSASHYLDDTDPVPCHWCDKKKKNYWIISFGKALMTICDKCAEGN